MCVHYWECGVHVCVLLSVLFMCVYYWSVLFMCVHYWECVVLSRLHRILVSGSISL